MALLQDIIAEATGETCDLPSLLRKTLVLASRLRNDDLKTWVGHELNGYPTAEVVPSYRRTEVISYGFFADRFVGQATLQIPVSVLPEEFREKYRNVVLQQPITEMVDTLRRTREKGSAIQLPWPPAARRYAQKVSELECISAWRQLNPSFMAGVIDTVKTRILSVALDLEAADPAAGDIASTTSSISERKVSQIITTHIHGTVQNFSAGGDRVTQSATMTVQSGDKESLWKVLSEAGLSATDLQTLETAIAADEVARNPGSPGLGERVKLWLGEMHLKAAQKLEGLTTEVVGGVVTQAILLYFGLAG